MDAPLVLRFDVDDAELVGLGARLANRGHGDARTGLDVLLDHLREVHPVDVVSADHHDDVGLLVVDQVQALVDGVRTPGEPVLAQALLRGDGSHVVSQQCRHPPRLGDVGIEAVGLVLGQHDDPQVSGVHDVGQREVDQAVDPAERYRRLRTVGGQRHEAFAFPAGQHDREHSGPVFRRRRHGTNLEEGGSRFQGWSPCRRSR